MPHPFTNSLVHETSPYLLQHAHNPVEWFAWGPEALAKAKQEDKLILVSIGYSACHWCHVMERESFENEATAAVMNRHFVNIKVDREERPDLDHIYMDAVQAISGAGGWPLNVFLTPDAKPFFGGTYFPPVRAFNRSSWTEVLEALSTAWAERKEEIRSQAENLVNHLQQSNSFGLANGLEGTGDINKEQCDAMFSAIMKSADKVWGGFGKAPKFPQTFTIRYLLHYHHFTGNTEALEQALLSIDKMLEGGIYDHIAGGLARYSTDGEWLAPHFEKMLYDNALLIIVLCDAYQLTRERKYEEATRSIINFVLNELSESTGGFYAALDADSEGEEGRYYVWQKEEIEEVVGPDAELFCTYFDVTDKGNWEGKNILHTLKPAPVFTSEKGMDLQDFEQLIGKCIEKLAARRAGRVRPALDDKCILGWNALMMSAIAKASTVLGDDSYREVAERNFNFLTANFRKQEFSSELFHTFKHKRAKYPAFLDDYAYLIAALLQLYKTTLELSYLEKSYEYCRYVVENFSDDDAVFFFFTHKGQKDVILRKKEIYDGAVPSGNAVMAENLYELAIIFDRPDWTSRADKMLGILLPTVVKYPGSFGIWARLTLQRLAGVNEVAVIGTEFALFSQKILLSFIPNLVLMSSPIEKEAFPLLAGKNPGASTQVYLCKNYTCLAPFPGIEPLLEQIDKTNKLRR